MKDRNGKKNKGKLAFKKRSDSTAESCKVNVTIMIQIDLLKKTRKIDRALMNEEMSQPTTARK